MKYSFATRAEWIMGSPFKHIRLNSQQASFVSLAEELPASDLFPLEALHTAATTVLSSHPMALQYGDAEGFIPLREWIRAEWKQHKQMEMNMNQILLTTGSQQAMDLIARVYVDLGDAVLVENPTSPGCLQILRMQGATIIPVEGDQEGLRLQSLDELIERHHPKLLFVSPNFSNPTGVLWSMDRRKQVLDCCRRHKVLIVEDDSYGDLYFEDTRTEGPFSRRYPTLCALDEHGKGGQVLYIGSFSKTVAPGLRIGFAMGHHQLIEVMGAAKQLADWQSSNLNQRLLYQLLESTTFDWHEHVALLRREYRIRLRLMEELLKRPAWRNARYHLPTGGMFLWIQLPGGLQSELLLKSSISKGVAFCPGTLCCVDKKLGMEAIRLNFTHPGRDELLLGMHLISEAVNEFTARS
ncbi:PLP-dependent aminotransferase family protein [Paenibacillus crassostreae]|uniref:Transcriptional regulator n=1 Tax=Paenibacillus crassostreae TaxID=1763538 RepID=A0A167GSK6_9BACL|nr:PLP-dependent aminotransferase family protein [Paenibacillus crassostreae]AOZ92053.1 transcriptional regulator [Paenibacillus crassostreae]OAB77862.1 transcriptional regulator [Paenibacillus crassostreae]